MLCTRWLRILGFQRRAGKEYGKMALELFFSFQLYSLGPDSWGGIQEKVMSERYSLGRWDMKRLLSLFLGDLGL